MLVDKGIFLLREKPEGEEELGSLLYQLAGKKETTIVLLEVLCSWHDRLIACDDYHYDITHTGSIGEWEYHTDIDMIILLKKVPLSNIKLLKVFNLLDCLKGEENESDTYKSSSCMGCS